MVGRLLFAAGLIAGTAIAQEPKMAACGMQGEVEIICGPTRQPEDLERTPDGKYLLVTQYIDEGRPGAKDGGVELFELATKRFRKMNLRSEPDASWGDPECPGTLGNSVVSHGSSLVKRADGKWAYYVVNHAGRQSIEMYELAPIANGWSLVWHGCEVAKGIYNDVAILPDGGFVGSYPPAGYVARWTRGQGESEAAGTRMKVPNGVVASPDGRFLYVNEMAARKVRKIETATGADLGSAGVDFMPDNLTWTEDGKLLAAGIKGGRGDCPADSGRRCIDGFGIAQVDPETMQSKALFDSVNGDVLTSGASVAIQAGDSIYVGAYLGERLLRIPYMR